MRRRTRGPASPADLGARGPVFDNRVGGALPSVGGLAVLGLLLAGCGARSALAEGVIEEGPACAPAPAVTTSRRLGTGAVIAAAVDGSGYPVIAGTATGPLDMGNGMTLPFTSIVDLYGDPGDGQVFLAKLAPGGCEPFALSFPASQPATHPLVESMGVAVGGEGQIVLTVSLDSPVDFGGGPVGTSPFGPTAAFAVFEPNGTLRFEGGLTASKGISIGQAAFDARGDVLVGGLFSGDLALDGAPIGSSGANPYAPGGYLTKGFLAKLDPGGALVWSTVVGTGTNDSPVDPIFSLSRFCIAAWPGGEAVLGVDGALNAFDAAGNARWQGMTGGEVTCSVDVAGELMVAGYNGSTIEIDRYDDAGTPLSSASFSIDAYAVALGVDGDALGIGDTEMMLIDRSGNTVWSGSYDGGISLLVPALGASGARYLTGSFQGTVDFGAGAMTALRAPDGTPTGNAFVAELGP